MVLLLGVYGEELDKAESVIDRFELLDISCSEKGIIAELVVVGGAGLMLISEIKSFDFRPTRDIDVALLSSNRIKELNDEFAKFQIEIIGGISELPPIEDFKKEDMIEVDLEFESIKVFVPSIEMLACTKIFTKREKDLLDLEGYILEHCDKELLLHMIEDYKRYALNLDDPDLNVHEVLNILNV